MIPNYQIKVEKLTDEFFQLKTEITNQNTLLTQEVQLTKINMQSQLQYLRISYEQNMQTIKTELQNEIKQLSTRFQEEKTFLESKCESLKKTNNSFEQQNLILKYELDKEKALYKEKQAARLRIINDLEERLQQELFNYTKTIECFTGANDSERKRLNQEIDTLRYTKLKLEDEKSCLAMERDAIETKLNSKISFLENKIKTNKADYDDLMNKFELASVFLNKNVEMMAKETSNLKNNLKIEFEQQISMKEDNYKKENKDYNDRIYRLQTENKSLRDKVILMEVKLASNSFNSSPSSDLQKLEEIKVEYMRREQQYRKLIEELKKQDEKLREKKESTELTKNYLKSKIISQNSKTKKESLERDQISSSFFNGLKFPDFLGSIFS